jgi:hypothetical protein
MLELYNALSNAQKHTIRRKYIYLFGCDRVSPKHTERTFHRKIKGEVRLLRAEIIFFENLGLVTQPLLNSSEPIPKFQPETETEIS